MSEPFIGEIRLFAGNFAPQGWAFCDGQLLQISQNDQLFTLIGTTYGGDGQTTFALPDLRGRVPIHQGPGPGLSTRPIGGRLGVEAVTLTPAQTPSHTHALRAKTSAGSSSNPAGALPANSQGALPYIEDAPAVAMAAGAVSPAGGGQPHENLQPFLCVSFIISLFGIFPQQS